MEDSQRQRRAAPPLLPLALAGTCLLATGCATYFMDQVKVPGTDQRLAVGHDGWPFKKAWVHDGGQWHAVKIVRRDR